EPDSDGQGSPVTHQAKRVGPPAEPNTTEAEAWVVGRAASRVPSRATRATTGDRHPRRAEYAVATARSESRGSKNGRRAGQRHNGRPAGVEHRADLSTRRPGGGARPSPGGSLQQTAVRGTGLSHQRQ